MDWAAENISCPLPIGQERDRLQTFGRLNRANAQFIHTGIGRRLTRVKCVENLNA